MVYRENSLSILPPLSALHIPMSLHMVFIFTLFSRRALHAAMNSLSLQQHTLERNIKKYTPGRRRFHRLRHATPASVTSQPKKTWHAFCLYQRHIRRDMDASFSVRMPIPPPSQAPPRRYRRQPVTTSHSSRDGESADALHHTA